MAGLSIHVSLSHSFKYIHLNTKDLEMQLKGLTTVHTAAINSTLFFFFYMTAIKNLGGNKICVYVCTHDSYFDDVIWLESPPPPMPLPAPPSPW